MKRLGPDVRLERVDGEPVLRYLGVPEPAPPQPLHPLVAAVLAGCDRGWSKERLEARLAERLGGPRAAMREIVDDVLICYRRHFAHDGAHSYVDVGDPDDLLATLPPGSGGLRSRQVVFPGDRAPFPLTVQWLVTRYCNRRCVYCYAGAPPSAKAHDAELPFERVCAILDEAARLGAYNFFITGGEPLLRDDAYDVVAHALRLGFEPEILTKQAVRPAEADKLAAAGLRRIFLSIDSLDAQVAEQLTGVRTFARDAGRTAELLRSRGIAVHAKTVLTALNVESLPLTLEGFEQLGVSWVRIETYSRNLQRHSDALAPSPEQIDEAARHVEAWRADTSRRLSVSFDPRRGEGPAREGLGEDCFSCHNGVTALLFLPDGRVSRCDKKLPGEEFVVGDLSRQSVHEVWNSPRMRASMKPARELYRGTLCHDCAHFDACHERGRCYYDAYLTSQTLYGPQSNCPLLGTHGQRVC